MGPPRGSTGAALDGALDACGFAVVTAGLFTIEFFEEDGGRSPVEDWMESELTDLELAALLAAFEHVLSRRGVNVWATERGKQLGEGLFEFRIRHTADEIESMFGPGSGRSGGRGQVLLRVFCHAYGAKIVLLLNGYDKGEDPSENASSGRSAWPGSALASSSSVRRLLGRMSGEAAVLGVGAGLTRYVLKCILIPTEGETWHVR